MKTITLDYSNLTTTVTNKEINDEITKNLKIIDRAIHDNNDKDEVLGWTKLDICANDGLIERIEEKAKEIRENADVFLLIGVGGSNQGARAVIEALNPEGTPKIIYTGNNLSPLYMEKVLKEIKGKSVYANIIAKNFATLEPGICFRMIRSYMEEVYGVEGAAERIIATGSPNGSSLEELAKEKGYDFYDFPEDIGGRFSVLSAVGLLPIAVSGVDIREIIKGAKEMERVIKTTAPKDNPAVVYATLRNILYKKDYSIEMMAFFEPLLEYFTKWWVQLFGESEGKEDKGLFPTTCSFSEELHSLGQYIQDGQKILFETFLNLEDQGASCPIPQDNETLDYFEYLDGKDFAYLNRVAFEATVKAHAEGGIPVMIFNIPELTPYYMGQLFLLFQYACYISASILGVNPFDQPGVEAYKENMFVGLGKLREEVSA